MSTAPLHRASPRPTADGGITSPHASGAPSAAGVSSGTTPSASGAGVPATERAWGPADPAMPPAAGTGEAGDELARLRQEAARYRFLRDQVQRVDFVLDVGTPCTDEEGVETAPGWTFATWVLELRNGERFPTTCDEVEADFDRAVAAAARRFALRHGAEAGAPAGPGA